ncbi:MAG: carnitine dehydratase [Candidatus Wallbacteria bacterium HGW-Wallbacteria-1]|uniref:Carnitine dehydratase n=1 Tax=Candidatus Wallbacteria bacterium HGW-Wallbacteria-1 TaxID=2013854 RepID=A0A2N1PP28_9BACT|nr:MAG: carnitine dehydratase [Candidatus Wallbacteria bacterium HGW-Wallbacteria-1]
MLNNFCDLNAVLDDAAPLGSELQSIESTDSSEVCDKPFDGIIVLDLTRVLAGPYCTMLLAQMGARVIKVERPGSGDDSRGFGPYVGGDKSKSAYFMSINWGKESITLDLKSEKGKDILRKLAARVDVIVENFRPGTMEKMGLGYEQLRQINPRLIYAASSGFGHYGPYSQRAAYDMIIQGMSGIMSITGTPGQPPVRVGASIADISAGMFCATGIITALYQRQKTGQGQKIDVAMMDAMIAMLENALVRYETSGNVPGPMGTRHPSITPFQAFATSDSHVIVAIGNDKLWSQFCNVIARKDLLQREEFATNELRTANHGILEKELIALFPSRSTAQWLALLDGVGIPCARINDMSDLFSDPHVKARSMLIPLADEGISVAGDPIKFSSMKPAESRPSAPDLGQHTDSVLKEFLNLSADDMQALHTDKIV